MIRLMRHAATVYNEQDRKYGSLDPTLSIRGYEQAFAVPLEFYVSGLYTSPMRRCRDTADIIGSRIATPYTVVPDLHERSFGEAEGMLRAEVDARWARRTDIPGYETDEELLARVLPAMEAIPDGALVITHAGVIRALTGYRLKNMEVVTWRATS